MAEMHQRQQQQQQQQQPQQQGIDIFKNSSTSSRSASSCFEFDRMWITTFSSGLAKFRCWRRRQQRRAPPCRPSRRVRPAAALQHRLQADQPLLLCSKMPARLRLMSPRALAGFSLPSLLPLAAPRSCGRSPAPPDRTPRAPWCGRPPHVAFRCGAADGGGGGVFSSARGL